MWTKSMGKLFTVCEWITKLAYLNFLWMVYIAAGLFIFGFMPASAALFAVIRKGFRKETDIPLWRTFHNAYKQEFIKSNIAGIFLFKIGIILFLDYWFLQYAMGVMQGIMAGLLLLLSVFYMTVLVFFFPVYVHYDLKLRDYFKYALLLGISHFHVTALIFILTALTVFLLLYMPGLIPFFGGISLAYIWTAGGVCIFRIMEERGRKMLTA
jgi:uncharacterized membrane protein YesL